jgi:predicted TIM-barrel fold metal-dependent hydrolase
MTDTPTLFDSTHDLARLPYFELRDGHLHRSGPVDRVVDVHTHLALAYVRRNRVDLDKVHDCTRHYLPTDRQLDLDVYANRNFTSGDLRRLKGDLGPMSLTGKGMRATHTLANLRRDMACLGISHSVLLPIDFPYLSRNAETYLEATATEDSLVSLGSVHPWAPDLLARLDRQVAAGAIGVKVHPAVQKVAPEHPRAIELYRACAERGLPVLWHCGPVGIESRLARRLCWLDRYAEAIRQCPEVTFVLGHSGALQFERALELCQRHENVHLEISCQSLANVRRIAAEAPAERVMFGSDWPFYHQAIPLAKALLATEGFPERRANLLWRNATRLFNLDPVLQEATS